MNNEIVSDIMGLFFLSGQNDERVSYPVLYSSYIVCKKEHDSLVRPFRSDYKNRPPYGRTTHVDHITSHTMEPQTGEIYAEKNEMWYSCARPPICEFDTCSHLFFYYFPIP